MNPLACNQRVVNTFHVSASLFNQWLKRNETSKYDFSNWDGIPRSWSESLHLSSGVGPVGKIPPEIAFLMTSLTSL